MQGNKHNMDDLEYLSQLGFEKVPTADADLEELGKKVKSRVFSYNNGLYFGFISLIVGIFIGVSLFFTVANKPVIYASNTPNKILNDTVTIKKNETKREIILDTVKVEKENFIHPRLHIKANRDTAQLVKNNITDSAFIIPAQPINTSVLLSKPIGESKLKYITNSPVVYIHDLKVTDYTTLYFKNNQYVKLSVKETLPVTYANKDDYNKNASLKQNADYYLHEELGEALLAFKKSKYEDCLYLLNSISKFNDDDINCNFYSGMCYYYKKNYTKAIGFFERCIDNSNNAFLQEAMFYNALALYENGDKKVATEKFKVIADEGEFYSEKAKGYLKN